MEDCYVSVYPTELEEMLLGRRLTILNEVSRLNWRDWWQPSKLSLFGRPHVLETGCLSSQANKKDFVVLRDFPPPSNSLKKDFVHYSSEQIGVVY